MSYILEALKKSERERARGRIPTLDTISGQGVSHKSLWLGVALGAGALLVLATIAWLVNYQFLRPQAPEVMGNAADSATSPARKAPEETTDPGEPRASLRVRRTGGDTQPGDAGGDAARRVADIDDLPAAARRRIEGLSVNVVSYSEEPARRFVMLNQRIVRESDTVGDGVIVKRITPKGAMLAVGDYEILIEPD